MWCFSTPADPGPAATAASPSADAAAADGGEPTAVAAPETTAVAGADTTDSDSDPGSAGSTSPPADAPVTCGPNAITPCPCAGAVVTSQTVMQEPPDRARTRIAVGERVELTYSLGTAAWAPADRLSAANGVSVTFTAPDSAGSVTLTATGGGCSASITLTIVEPDAVHMIKRFSNPVRVGHIQNTLSMVFTTNVFVAPTDVNFHRIQILELEAFATASGVLATSAGLGHNPNANGTGFTTHVQAGMGTFLAAHDTVGFRNPTPWSAPQTGDMLIAIPWRWRVGGAGAFKRLRTVNQRFNVSAAGLITGTKAGARASVHFADPTRLAE